MVEPLWQVTYHLQSHHDCMQTEKRVCSASSMPHCLHAMRVPRLQSVVYRVASHFDHCLPWLVLLARLAYTVRNMLPGAICISADLGPVIACNACATSKAKTLKQKHRTVANVTKSSIHWTCTCSASFTANKAGFLEKFCGTFCASGIRLS